ncbi:MAG: glycosyltransferase [Rikenellaceae bacterium]
MSKLLSIIIPTYNMEEYLPRCLDSVVGTQYIGEIEIIVVNDGSKDRSSEIAHTYKSRFSESVIVVDKENGNYGSTINAALPVATGKYVKVLDSDDWFDTAAFDSYIEQLRDIEADLIVTPFTVQYITGESEIRDYHMVGRDGVDYDLSIFYSRRAPVFAEMHAITYRLKLLIDNNYKQIEGISYTDTEWACYPMEYVKIVKFVSTNLYQYFMGREGQTVSTAEASNNFIKHLTIIYSQILRYIADKQNDSAGVEYIYYKICRFLIVHIYNHENLSTQDELLKRDILTIEDCVVCNKKLYDLTDNYALRRYLCFKLVRHWRGNNKQLSKSVRFLCVTTDRLRNLLHRVSILN